MRLRLDIVYDGTAFHGWAKQPGLRTVEGALEGALERILGGTPRLVVAGRTDAGVHASGQVAHIDLTEAQQRRLLRQRDGDTQDPITVLARRMRGVLGRHPDLHVAASSLAADGFDARFSAVWRRYTYRLGDDVTGYDPFERLRTTQVKGRHDLDAMNEAASRLIGLHDFAAYCKPRERATTIRTLLEFTWIRDADGVLVASLQADAFCHSMVRAMVGACSAVGRGSMTPDDVERLRDTNYRTSEINVIAPHGLTLTEVGYPEDSLLGLRAEQTRARRAYDDD